MEIGDRVKSKKTDATGTIKKISGEIVTIERDPEFIKASENATGCTIPEVRVWISDIKLWEPNN